MNESKKLNLQIVLSLFILVVMIGGVTFSFFNYTRTGEVNEIVVGNIYLNYEKISEENLHLTNVFPTSTYDSSKYFEFKVEGYNEYSQDIIYAIDLLRGDIDSEAERILDKHVKFTLKQKIDDEEETTLLDGVSYKDLSSGKRIYVDKIDANTEVADATTHRYKLYMWIDNSILISDTDANADYTTAIWNKAQASFRIRVVGDFEAKEVDSEPSMAEIITKKLQDDASSSSYIKNYTTEFINKTAQYPGYKTQDTVGTNSNKQDVYFYTGSGAVNTGNLLFAGYCWQVVRTTDTGGTRILYNGIAVNDKCEDSRSSITTWKGVNGTDAYTARNIASPYLYGTSFDYDLDAGTFSLVNPDSETKTWSYATYADFVGKYTCLNTTGTNCTKMYYVGGFNSTNNNQAWVEEYSIGSLADYRQIGKSVYNPGYYESPAQVGYMYNTTYTVKNQNIASGALVGSSVSYDNDVYTLTGVYTDAEETTPAVLDAYHHYTCNSTTETTCATVRYYYYNGYYIELTGGEAVETALKNMINYGSGNDTNINLYSSAIKGYLDVWYNKNLATYESYIDTSAVYCNDRSVTSESNLGGWKKDGGTLTSYLYFKQGNAIDKNLGCDNVTDRFSKGNISAQLSNPIGLLTEPERGLMTYSGGNTYAAAPNWYWGLSPYYFDRSYAFVRFVNTSGGANGINVYIAGAVRAALTLRPDTEVVEGTGAKDDPYVVGPKVTRAN